MRIYYIKVKTLAEAREDVNNIKSLYPDIYINSIITALIADERSFKHMIQLFPHGMQYNAGNNFLNMMTDAPSENHLEFPRQLDYIDEC